MPLQSENPAAGQIVITFRAHSDAVIETPYTGRAGGIRAFYNSKTVDVV